MNRNWFPSNLIIPLRETFLDCGPFDTDRQLRAAFAHPSLKLWQNRLPGADSRQDRVDLTIDFLLSQYTNDGANGLILFLQVLSERVDPNDACHQRLIKLVDGLNRPYRGETSTSTGHASDYV